MQKFFNTVFLVATTLMVTACAYHGTWSFSAVKG